MQSKFCALVLGSAALKGMSQSGALANPLHPLTTAHNQPHCGMDLGPPSGAVGKRELIWFGMEWRRGGWEGGVWWWGRAGMIVGVWLGGKRRDIHGN